MSEMSSIPDGDPVATPLDAAEAAAEAAGTVPAARPPGAKPRLGIMGEFSAGKSTLSNLLLGARPLPERVTATRLSPVWISQGTDAPVSVGTDGTETPVALEMIESLPVETTRCIRMSFQSDILELCDLIDFPGISDPNMDSEVWERMLDEVDMVLWCTHATQAWRQSEASVWEVVPEAVRDRSLLLITRFDKLTTERDRGRVLRRIEAEAGPLFKGVFPISLIQALAAGGDPSGDGAGLWESSGAAAFADALIPALQDFAAASAAGRAAPPAEAAPPAPHEAVLPRRVRRPAAAGGSGTARPGAPSGGADALEF